MAYRAIRDYHHNNIFKKIYDKFVDIYFYYDNIHP